MTLESTRRTIAIIEEAIVAEPETAPAGQRILAKLRASIAEAEVAEAAERSRAQQLRASAGVEVYGTREDATGDTVTHWFVLRWDGPRRRRLHYLARLGVPFARVRCHSGDWDCCGRLGTEGARIRRTATRILVTCTWSRDV